ncbi:hypothetical protein Tco_0494399 [Tanacetum coccineum]
MEYLMNISKRRAFWSLNKDILKINDSGYQYAVSIKEDMAYQCLHSTKTTKETSSIRCIQRRPIRRIEDIVCEDSGRYRMWSLLQDTPNMLYPIPWIRLEKKEVAWKGGISFRYDGIDIAMKSSDTAITSITVNGKNAYELKGKFLDDLHNNAFSGTNRKYAVEYIEYFLKIVGPINLPNVDHDKLIIVVFSISLVGADPRVEGWLATKFVNYKTMDEFTKGALWDYWKMDGDEIEVSDDESSDLEEYWSNKEEETTEIFKIETNVFYYETPLCLAFNDFNYLLKVDPNLLTKDIMRFKTYEDYKDDWIYEWNENVPWVYDKPWLDNGIWKEPTPVKHRCKPFNYKTECSEWLTCSWREDGYCNGGNLHGAYHIGNSLHYKTYKCRG